MPTTETNSLEYLRRLCADPLLLDHEAACGAVLAEPEPGDSDARGTMAQRFAAVWNAGLSDWQRIDDPDALLREIQGRADAASAFAGMLAGLPLPDGDDGWSEQGERAG